MDHLALLKEYKEDSMFLQNAGTYLQVHTVLQPRRPASMCYLLPCRYNPFKSLTPWSSSLTKFVNDSLFQPYKCCVVNIIFRKYLFIIQSSSEIQFIPWVSVLS
jgi:hypothetical protein